jgi:hypothetical protein
VEGLKGLAMLRFSHLALGERYMTGKERKQAFL